MATQTSTSLLFFSARRFERVAFRGRPFEV
jgi:hypothetical protein